jgi:membrane protease YdiL (CAAX protease family)
MKMKLDATAAEAKKKLYFYLILVAGLGVLFYYPILMAGALEPIYVIGLMWCPAVAALVTRLVLQRNLRGMGWGWGETRYQLGSYLLPVAAGTIVYGSVWLSGLGGFASEQLTSRLSGFLGQESYSLPSALILAATVGFALDFLLALGEEIGWRGLLVPELAKLTSFTRTALVSAAVWAVYHYPALLLAGYHSAAPVWYGFVWFTMSIFAASFVFAWLRLKSGSLWTGVILHASHNLFIQSVFDRLMVDRGVTQYITTEFGAGLAMAYGLMAFYLWRRRLELPHRAPGQPVLGVDADRERLGQG